MIGHLNSFSASGGGNLSKNFPKIQMPGGLLEGGMLKLRFDWYITHQDLLKFNLVPRVSHLTAAWSGLKTFANKVALNWALLGGIV